jgi:hypothetical protein
MEKCTGVCAVCGDWFKEGDTIRINNGAVFKWGPKGIELVSAPYNTHQECEVAHEEVVALG